MGELHLNLMLGGIGSGNWLHPEANPAELRSLEGMAAVAQAAEAAKLDALFYGDLMSTRAALSGGAVFGFEPVTAYSALAGLTEKIGLIVTLSTSYQEPFNVARRLASLDHISQGRAGWNMVTTLVPEVAGQFGAAPHPSATERYARAEEFVTVTKALWDSWSHEAIQRGADGRPSVDGSLNRQIDHQGEYFSVRGPLDVCRPVQGHPVLAQAGSSQIGQDFAARHGEVIFTAQPSLARALAFRQGVLARAQAQGRDATALRVMPGLVPILGGTEAEAQRLARDISERKDPRAALATLSKLLGIDLAALPADQPIDPALLPDMRGEDAHSRAALYVDLIREKRLSPAQLLEEKAHWSFVGTPEQMAAALTEWHNAGAVDGFTLMAPWLSSGITPFLSEVVPALQKQGLFRTDYRGQTLRSHLGLRPPSRI